MDITYLGHSSFRLRGKNATVVTDPFDSSVGFKFPKVDADIVTISHQHDDHNKYEQVGGEARVVDGPGEYEIKGVSMLGFDSYHDNKKGKLRGKNTIFVIEIDGLRIVHLGDLGHKLSEKQAGKIGEIDLLLIPIGGEYTINSADAVAITQDLEPKIVIPMHFQQPGLEASVFGKLEGSEKFIKDLGLPVETMNKLSIKRGSLAEDSKSAVILTRK